jgi:hypothetical protein
MKIKTLAKKVITIALTLVVAATFFFSPTTTAYANDPYLDKTVPHAGMTDKDIEYMNQHELDWLTTQNKVFREAYQLEASFQSLIDRMVLRHGEAPELDIMLGTYDTSFLQAQAVQTEAAKVIGAQSGFDAQGHVTNREWALQTVKTGREHLINARYQLRLAIRTLHKSYNTWHNWLINGVKYK